MPAILQERCITFATSGLIELTFQDNYNEFMRPRNISMKRLSHERLHAKFAEDHAQLMNDNNNGKTYLKGNIVDSRQISQLLHHQQQQTNLHANSFPHQQQCLLRLHQQYHELLIIIMITKELPLR